MADIFISYSRQDKARVAPLVAALEAEGWSVWWDPEISPGEEFDALISRELEAARSLVVVWTAQSVESRWVRGEARDAADRGVLVPVRLDGAKLPIDFRAVHTTDLDGWAENSGSPSFKGLVKALETKLGAPRRTDSGPGVVQKKPTTTICVLPFANMSGDPEQEYFSDGITEDVITDLGKISALSVVSRSLAFSFKGSKGGVSEIGRQTKASHVLIGSVRKAGDRVRITAQLVDATNDAQIWGERYDRDLKAIFELQDEISKAIVAALKVTLLPEEKAALEQRATNNPEAYKLYLIGRQLWHMDNTRNSELCVRICRRVVELDPNYAQAWATLALAQWDVYHRGESQEDGALASATALALDPLLPDAYAAVAESHRYEGRFAEGLEVCSKALRLDAKSYMSNRVAGMCLMGLRRFAEAAARFEAAVAALESDIIAATFAVQCYEATRDTGRATEAARRALSRVEKVIATQPDHSRAIGFGVGLLATLGEKERAREWVLRGQLLDPANVVMLYNFSCAMVQLGDVETAFELLREFTANMQPGLLRWFESDSDFDPIRHDPRFVAMLEDAKQRLGAVD